MSRRRVWVPSGLLLLGLGCWPSVPERPDPTVFLGLEPKGNVEPEQTVELAFSSPLRPAEFDWPVEVLRPDGRRVPLVLPEPDWRARLPLLARDGWPAGEQLVVSVGSGLVDFSGRPFDPTGVAPSFETRVPRPAPTMELRMPRPSEAWPLNLRTAAVVVSPADLPVDQVWLRGLGQRWRVEITGREEGRLRLRLPRQEGDCAPLCAHAPYHLELETGAQSVESMEVWTATTSDRRPPTVQVVSASSRGASFLVDLSSDEPVVFEAWARSAEGHEVALSGPVVPGLFTRLETEAPLHPESVYWVLLHAEDLSGNPAESRSFEVRTPPAARIHFSELVLSPLRDWGDSEPAGQPFDAEPGQGTVSAADQWVELVNLGAQPIDLRSAGLLVRALDTTPAETWLASAPALHFGSGGTLAGWWPGEALVVRLRGQMSKSELVLELHQDSALLDRVEIGRSSSADHVGGTSPDLVHEAVAKDELGRFRFCVPSPGDPTPPVRCLSR